MANLVEELIRDANSRQYQYVLIGLLSLKIIIYYGMAIVSLEKALLVSRPMRWGIKFGLFVETKISENFFIKNLSNIPVKLYRTVMMYRDKEFVFATWLIFIIVYASIYGAFTLSFFNGRLGIKCLDKLTCRLCCQFHEHVSEVWSTFLQLGMRI